MFESRCNPFESGQFSPEIEEDVAPQPPNHPRDSLELPTTNKTQPDALVEIPQVLKKPIVVSRNNSAHKQISMLQSHTTQSPAAS